MKKFLRSTKYFLCLSFFLNLFALNTEIASATTLEHTDYRIRGYHTHRITNNSEDANLYLILDKFRIKFIGNNIDHVDLETLECTEATTPTNNNKNGYGSCTNGKSNLHGGTKVTSSEDGSIYTAEWEFAEPGNEYAYDGRPMLAGQGKSFYEEVRYYVKSDTPDNTPVITEASVLVSKSWFKDGKFQNVKWDNGEDWKWIKIEPGTIYYHRPLPEIEKTSSTAADVQMGDDIIYNIKIKNNSSYSPLKNTDKQKLIISDELSEFLDINTVKSINNAGAKLEIIDGKVEWVFAGDLEPLASKNLSFSAKVKSDLNQNSTIYNYADFYNEEVNKRDGPTIHTVSVPQNPSADITKYANYPDGSYIDAGSTINYTLGYENNGDKTLSSVEMTDYLSKNNFSSIESSDAEITQLSGVWILKWKLGTLKPGQKGSVAFKATTRSDLPKNHKITNKAFISSPTLTGSVFSNEIIHYINGKAKLEITKTADKPNNSGIYAGDNLIYTLSYKNTGDETAKNVTITDNLSSTKFSKVDAKNANKSGDNYTWNIGNLGPNQSGSISFTVTSKTSLPKDTLILNYATIDADNTDSEISDPTRHYILGPQAKPLLNISKKASPETNSEILAGTQITYTLVISNTGTGEAVNVEVRDDLSKTLFSSVSAPGSKPSGDTQIWNYPSLAAGEEKEITFTATTRSDLKEGTLVENHANIDADDLDPKNSNQTVHKIIKEKIPLLKIEKSSNPNYKTNPLVDTGQKITYTLTYENIGNAKAQNIIIQDELKSQYFKKIEANQDNKVGDLYYWYPNDLNPGEKASISFDVYLRDDLIKDTQIINYAKIRANDVQETQSNKTIHVIKGEEIKLAIAGQKSSNPISGSYIQAGTEITYYINFQNTGNGDLNQLEIQDVLEKDKFDLNSIVLSSAYIYEKNNSTPTQITTGSVDKATRIITWTLARSFKPNQIGQASFRVKTLKSLPENTIIKNIATFTSQENINDKTNEVTHIIDLPTNIAYIDKTANYPIGSTQAAGSKFVYTINYENRSNQTLKNIIIRDILDDPEYTLPPLDITGNYNYNNQNKTITWQIGDLAPKSTGSVSFAVYTILDISKREELLNHATLYSNRAVIDSNVVNHFIEPLTVPEIIKTSNPVSGSFVASQEEITYFINYYNPGPETLKNAKIEDKLDAKLDIDTLTVFNNGIPPKDGRTITWEVGDIAPKTSASVSFNIKTEKNLNDGDIIFNFASIVIPNESAIQSDAVKHIIKNYVPKPALELSKEATPPHNSTIQAGKRIFYTIHFKNTGETPLTSFSIEDPLDNGKFDLSSLQIEDALAFQANNAIPIQKANGSPTSNGQTIQWTFPQAININEFGYAKFSINTLDSLAEDTEIINYAYIYTDQLGQKRTNDVIHKIKRPEDIIKITKTANPSHNSTIDAGQSITYFVEIENISKNDLLNIYIKDILDDPEYILPPSQISDKGTYTSNDKTITWNIGTLEANKKIKVNFTVSTKSSINKPEIIENEAKVYSNRADLTSNIVKHYISPKSLIKISKNSIPAPDSNIISGEKITYIINFENIGETNLNSVKIQDSLFDEASKFDLNSIIQENAYIYTSSDPSNPKQTSTKDYDSNEKKLTWEFADPILPGEFGIASFTITTAKNLASGTQIANKASISTQEIPNTISNEVKHYIIDLKDLIEIKKSSDPVSGTQIDAGNIIHYSIDFTNKSDRNIQNIVIEDMLEDPAFNLNKTIEVSHGGTFDQKTNTVEWSIPELTSKESKQVSFKVHTFEGINKAEIIDNFASLHFNGIKLDSNLVYHTIIPKTDVLILKSANPPHNSQINSKDKITYTIKYENKVGNSIRKPLIRDILDNNLDIDTLVINNNGILNSSTRTITWPLSDPMPAGATGSVSYSIKTLDSRTSGTTIYNYATFYSTQHLIDSNIVKHIIKSTDPSAKLKTIKSSIPISGSQIEKGSEITYIIDFENTGSKILNNLSVIDTLDKLINKDSKFELTSLDLSKTKGIIYTNDINNPSTTIIGTLKDKNLHFNFNTNLNPGEKGQVIFTIKTRSNLDSNIKEVINFATVKTDQLIVDTNITTHYFEDEDLIAYVYKDSIPKPNTQIMAGSKITYLLNFENKSSKTTLSRVRIQDLLNKDEFDVASIRGDSNITFSPSGTIKTVTPTVNDNEITWELGNLNAGESALATFSVNTLATLDEGDLVKNFFTLYSDQVVIDSNIVQHSLTISTEAEISKESIPVSGETISRGGQIVYTLTYENTGSIDILKPYIIDELSDHLDHTTLAEISNNGTKQYDSRKYSILWSLGDKLAPGASGTVTYKINAKNSLPNGTVIYNYGTLFADGIILDSNVTKHTIKLSNTTPSCTLDLNPNSIDAKNTSNADITATVTLFNHVGTPDAKNITWSVQGSGAISPLSGNFVTHYSNATKDDQIKAIYIDQNNPTIRCEDLIKVTKSGGGGGGSTCDLYSINPNSAQNSSETFTDQYFLAKQITKLQNGEKNTLFINNTYRWEDNFDKATSYKVVTTEKDPISEQPEIYQTNGDNNENINYISASGDKVNPILFSGQINNKGESRILRIINQTYESRNGENSCRRTVFLKRTGGGGGGGSCTNIDLVLDKTNPLKQEYELKIVKQSDNNQQPSGSYSWSLRNEDKNDGYLSEYEGLNSIFTAKNLGVLPTTIYVTDQNDSACNASYTIKKIPTGDSSCNPEYDFELIVEDTQWQDIKRIYAHHPQWNGQLKWEVHDHDMGDLYNPETAERSNILYTPNHHPEGAVVYFIKEDFERSGAIHIRSIDNKCRTSLSINNNYETIKEELIKTANPTVVTTNNQIVNYEIAYIPHTNISEVSITDTVSTAPHIIRSASDNSQFIKANTNTITLGYKNEGNQLKNHINKCEADTSIICIDGDKSDFFTPGGIKIRNIDEKQSVIINYTGTVNARINCDDKDDPNSRCGLKFPNTAQSDATQGGGTILKASAAVWYLCPYLLTRNTGDVFLENPFTIGADVSCIDPDVRNTTGLALLGGTPPEEKEIIKTGEPAWYDLTSSLCDNSLAETGEKNNNLIIGRFSSFICELETDLQLVWQQTNIEQLIEDNKETILKPHKRELSGNKIVLNSFADLQTLSYTQPNSRQNVYKITDKDLEIGTLDFPNKFKIPASQDPNKSAAYTFVIENGDLYIADDIVYEANPSNLVKHSQIPSIAFVVLDGTIHVHPRVKEIAGIYVTQSGDGKDSGKFMSYRTIIDREKFQLSYNQLTVNGSVYGDLEPLFASRKKVGNPKQDTGAIVIYYDQRVILNTPPALKELINLNWEEVARIK